MRIRCGYDLSYQCPQPTPMLLMISVHPSRANDMLTDGTVAFQPWMPASTYTDGFGNLCTRILAPAGLTRITTDFIMRDSGLPDEVAPLAEQMPVEDVPDYALEYLLGSRYCETDRLSETAWSLFGYTAPGWQRVQAICSFVHQHIRFDYQQARSTRTAWEGFQERVGVCRDFAHLAVTFCRCMNIPARYCTGYLGDIGVPLSPDPMDFSAWFDVFLRDPQGGGRWYTCDARHNVPRIGRILMARGRDATDIAISNSFGSAQLAGFQVVTDELPE
jgi:transglutaminase-like putative cysteine protease